MFDFLKSLFTGTPRESPRDVMRFPGRARWIVHLFDEMGEELHREYPEAGRDPGFEDVLVFSFSPSAARPFWTYVTAGVSIAPAWDGHPPTEFIAYAEQESPALVDLLYQMGLQVPAGTYQAGDLVDLDEVPPDLGIALERDVGLMASSEGAALLDFPNLGLRPEDRRYVMARPGEDPSTLQLLRVVALKNADGARFLEQTDPIRNSRAWRLF